MVEEKIDNVNLLWVCLLVEGGLLAIALSLSWFGLFDHAQPLSAITELNWASIIKWGLIYTLPMLGYLALFHFWKPKFYQPLQRIVETKLRPMFCSASVTEILIISLMAGIGEELFFRWCIQGGIASMSASLIGTQGSLIVAVGVASVFFGLCHWVNAIYGITTFLVSIYLGLVMIWTGSWIVPAIAHAVFDFIAIIYIVRRRSPAELEHPIEA